MRKLNVLLVFLSLGVLFAQSDRGTITGTVSDATGALIPATTVELMNTETGATYRTVTTDTGNYTIASLPVGAYTLTVQKAGFTTYIQTGIRVQVAVTSRVNVALQVGQTTESIEVTAEASLLKTESAEQSTTIAREQINDLPINFGIGAGAIRNPLSFVQLTPGATITGWNTIRVNGNPSGGSANAFRILLEGQEASSSLDARVSDELQPSVEAIQEFTLQTSNFAAEFGMVGSALFNFTSRSGTNRYHGSAYDYIVNEAFNAGVPFTDTGSGEHIRPTRKLHDFGASIGGPVRIPKIYDGRNRTFFFFNYERYRDKQSAYLGLTSVPTSAMRGGDLSALLTGRNLGTDFAGRSILENTIYDPATRTTDSQGRYVLQPFAGNIIPGNRIDPVAAAFLTEVPAPYTDDLVNNYERRSPASKIQQIPSIKIDHNITSTGKIAGYYSYQSTNKINGQDGLPYPISRTRVQAIESNTARINYDDALSPTVLLHLGAGVQTYYNPDTSPPEVTEYDAAGKLGIKGTPGTGFPRVSGIGGNTYGGLALTTGPANRQLYRDLKPTAVASVTWISGNHSIKGGGEWKIDTFTNLNAVGLSPAYSFSGSQTGQPLYGQTISGGSIGYGFASFLLGEYNSASIANTSDPQFRRASVGMFVQDTWKIGRKLTLDYGLRYDLQKPSRELWRRTTTFDPTLANPNADNLPGALAYEGVGPGRCNCDFIKTYRYAFAPRIGVAYQITDKTVLRAGWGLSYSTVNPFSYAGASPGTGFNSINWNSLPNGVAAGKLNDGLVWDPIDLYGASYDPGLRVVPGGSLQSATSYIDPNSGRPPRVNQWNISVQRELMANMVVEAAYVGNRGVWVTNNSLVSYNAVNPTLYTALGLDITNSADRSLLTSSIGSSNAQAHGFTKPYSGFASSNTVVQSLKPFPQYSGVGSSGAPLGKNWYDSFQLKVTKRYSHGFDFSFAYAFAKGFQWGSSGSIYDRGTFKTLSTSVQPHTLTFSANYRVPAAGFLASNRVARFALSGWTIGTILSYSSGALLSAPTSNNGITSVLPGLSGTRQFRVEGEPLFLKDLNCGCIDPTKELVLNPDAWQDQATGTYGTYARYYNDFRGPRMPVESMSIGKEFPFAERVTFSVRAEFFNVFNRLILPNPGVGNPTQTTRYNSDGLLTAGFGRINYNSVGAPRSGQIVARIQF